MFTAVPPLMAPQTTGHPAGLPQDVARQNPETRITAPKEGAATANAQGDTPSGQKSPFPKGADGKATAPPTILQIRINSMLEEQQRERDEQQAEQTAAEAPEAGTSELDRAAPAAPAEAAPKAPAPEEEPAPAVAKPAIPAALYGPPSTDATASGQEVSLTA